MTDPLVEITRSFTEKAQLGSYQSADAFCSIKCSVNLSEASATSEKLAAFCKEQVLRDLKKLRIERGLIPAEPEPNLDRSVPPFQVYAADLEVGTAKQEISNSKLESPKKRRTKKEQNPEEFAKKITGDLQAETTPPIGQYEATDDDVPSFTPSPTTERLRKLADNLATKHNKSVESVKHSIKAFVINYLEVKRMPSPDYEAEQYENILPMMEGFDEARSGRLCDAPFILASELKAPITH